MRLLVQHEGLTQVEVSSIVEIVDRLEDEEVTRVIDWNAEPDDILREHLVPKALHKLSEHMDSPNPMVVTKAVEKTLDLDRRFAKNQPPTNQLTFNFPPEYLRNVTENVHKLFGGKRDAPIDVDEPTLPAGGKPGVHLPGVEKPE